MENNQTEPQPDKVSPASTVKPELIYPTPVADTPSTPIAAAIGPEPAQPTKTISTSSIVLLVLLALTFFTPLGAILFLPLLIVGFFAAYKYVSKPDDTSSSPVRKTGVMIVKVILIIGGVIVLGILGLIALLFIAIAGGFGEFRMGS